MSQKPQAIINTLDALHALEERFETTTTVFELSDPQPPSRAQLIAIFQAVNILEKEFEKVEVNGEAQ